MRGFFWLFVCVTVAEVASAQSTAKYKATRLPSQINGAAVGYAEINPRGDALYQSKRLAYILNSAGQSRLLSDSKVNMTRKDLAENGSVALSTVLNSGENGVGMYAEPDAILKPLAGPNYPGIFPQGVNTLGFVIGQLPKDTNATYIQKIGSAPVKIGPAMDIEGFNDSGAFVGNGSHAYYYSPETGLLQDPEGISTFHDIAADGTAVFRFFDDTIGFTEYGIFKPGTTTRRFGKFNGRTFVASRINKQGFVLGELFDLHQATLWSERTGFVDLLSNTSGVPSDVFYMQALDIADNGNILVSTNNGTYVLSQVPEPLSLATIGVGMVGAIAWKRRLQTSCFVHRKPA